MTTKDVEGLISAATRTAAKTKLNQVVKEALDDEIQRRGWTVARAWVKSNKSTIEKMVRDNLRKNLDKHVKTLTKDVMSRLSLYLDD